MSCSAAALAEWRVRRLGSEAAPAAALTGFGPALFMAIVGTPRMRSACTPEGVANYPGIWAFTGISYVLGFYAARMTPPLRTVLAAAAAAQLAGSWLSSARPRSGPAFGGELIWASAAMFAGNRLAAALDKLSTRVAAENEQQTNEHAQAQRLAGWAHQHREAELLHELARQTMDQAQPQTQRHRDKIRKAHEEHERLTEYLRHAAAPPDVTSRNGGG